MMKCACDGLSSSPAQGGEHSERALAAPVRIKTIAAY